MSSYAVVIPTLNAGPQAHDLIGALRMQRLPVTSVTIIDSGSIDGTADLFRKANFKVHSIGKGEFDHGGTRNLGVALSAPAEIVVFLTQDALPADPNSIAGIIAPFEDKTVGLVCGRQLPRVNAGQIEMHARYYNYPATSNSRTLPQVSSLGIKVIFNSNSFAAYRVQALEDVGGFPKNIIMGEDQVASARMLMKGWKVIYQADAAVRHSHGYSIVEEFKRYFDIGVFHNDQRDLLAHFGGPESEGRRFIWSEIRHLLTRAPMRIPESLLRNAMKLVGYKIGAHHQSLPVAFRRRLSMNARYFDFSKTASSRKQVAEE